VNDQLKERGRRDELDLRHGKRRILIRGGPELRVQRICDRILEGQNKFPRTLATDNAS
jgi:hypothetical protein